MLLGNRLSELWRLSPFAGLAYMDFETVKAWLTRQTTKQLRIHWLCAVLGIVLTPVGLGISALLAFAAARAFGGHSTDPGINEKCAWVAAGCIPVLFGINFL